MLPHYLDHTGSIGAFGQTSGVLYVKSQETGVTGNRSVGRSRAVPPTVANLLHSI